MMKINFVMEQHLGHQTFYQNLFTTLSHSKLIDPHWVPVTYHVEDREWFSGLPFGGELIARQEVINGILKRVPDVNFFSTQVPAVLTKNFITRWPYVLCTDITPIQYDEMALFYDHKADSNSVLSRIKHRMNTEVFQHASHFITWSQWVAESLVNDYGMDRSKISVVPVGVNLSRWAEKTTLHPIDRPLQILFVGGDFVRKGGDLLLEAFRRLPAGSAELHIVTRESIAPTPGVTVYHNLKPNTPTLIQLYQQSDVFVLPSRAEAFGIAAVEASATGLACIVSKTGGLSEIVEHGSTGYHVDIDSVDDIVWALEQLVNDRTLAGRMGEKAAERTRCHYSASRNASRIVEIIQTSSLATLN